MNRPSRPSALVTVQRMTRDTYRVRLCQNLRPAWTVEGLRTKEDALDIGLREIENAIRRGAVVTFKFSDDPPQPEPSEPREH